MASIASPTGTCRHCGKAIRRQRQGVWGARKHDDPHPWYCDASPSDDKRHGPWTASDLQDGHIMRLGSSDNYVKVASAVVTEGGRVAVTIYNGETPSEGAYRTFAADEPVTFGLIGPGA